MHWAAQEQTRRPRDAAATRAAILAAARAAFTEESYDQVGVRDVAAAAGVDPALVIRYFGSKEGLFAAAVAGKFHLGELLAGDRATFGERIARAILHKKPAGEYDPLLALLRSSSNDEAGTILCGALDEQILRPLAAWLGGEQAELRAGLLLAYVLGLMVGRNVLRTEPLGTADVEALVALVAPTMQALVAPPPPEPPSAEAP